jgi:hypothetical protein
MAQAHSYLAGADTVCFESVSRGTILSSNIRPYRHPLPSWLSYMHCFSFQRYLRRYIEKLRRSQKVLACLESRTGRTSCSLRLYGRKLGAGTPFFPLVRTIPTISFNPPDPFLGVPHVNSEDEILDGYLIKAGTSISVNTVFILSFGLDTHILTF